jgi:hypothetical protein
MAGLFEIVLRPAKGLFAVGGMAPRAAPSHEHPYLNEIQRSLQWPLRVKEGKSIGVAPLFDEHFGVEDPESPVPYRVPSARGAPPARFGVSARSLQITLKFLLDGALQILKGGLTRAGRES